MQFVIQYKDRVNPEKNCAFCYLETREAFGNKMRILFITEHFLPKVDGVVTRICHAVENLVLNGHSVAIITGKTHLREYKGAEVFSAPSFQWPFYKEKHILLPSRQFKKLIQSFNPDIIHAVNPMIAGYLSIKLAKKLKVVSVASLHTNYPNYLKHYHLSAFKKHGLGPLNKSI